MSHLHPKLHEHYSLLFTGISLLMSLWTSAAVVIAADDDTTTWRNSNDPVAKLWRKLETGKAKLDPTSEQTLLRDILRELDIPVESQVLVFSKTSLQKTHIDPTKPRALYYNEESYIGWVQGGDLEIATSEPGGEMQYYLVHRETDKNTPPTLIKSNQCLSCHVGGELQVQSVHTRDSGYPMGNEDRFITTYESPLSERWGGWYVTGQHGNDLHMGNVTVEYGPRGLFLDRQKGANVESLDHWLDLTPYPIGTSDIVALMVLEHQYVLHNAMHESARAIRRLQHRKATQSDDNQQIHTTLNRSLKRHSRELVDLLLYVGEYQLQKGGVKGNDAFIKTFQRNRKTSSQGTSLKDFDLQTRLFKYRCSYMIHSTTFKALPEDLRRAIYERLDRILSNQNTNDEYDHLDLKERQTIRQILLETEPEAKLLWQK